MNLTNINDNFKCRNSDCHYESFSFNRLLSHTWDKHSLSPNFQFKCSISSCTRLYTNLQSFRRHVKAKHQWFFEKHMQYFQKETEENLQENQRFEQMHEIENAQIPEQEILSSDEDDENLANTENFLDIIAHFLLEVRENYNVTTAATCFISEKLGLILKQDRQAHSKEILKSLATNETFNMSYEVEMALNSDSPFSIACQRFSGQKALSKYIQAKKDFVEPKELQIEFNAETLESDKVQYIPIFDTLNVLLNDRDTFSCHIEENRTMPDSKTLKNFHDGIAFQENILLSSDKNTIELIFYHDDFNVVNPLGNKTVKYKTSAFYFVLGKLPSKYRSKLSDIHLVLLTSALLVSKYGYGKILQPVLNDIKELETKGFDVTFEGLTHLFYGTISMIIADNLAAHYLAGFFCNFSTVHRFCRFCNITKDELQENKKISSFDLRTKLGYDNNVRDINLFPDLASVYGVKSNSCLHELQYFHVTNGFPPDLAHDLFEGIAVDILTTLFSYFIDSDIFTLACLNSSLKNFEYCEIDKANKPQEFKVISSKKFKIKETACEMWNLIRLAPLMVGGHVPLGNPIWRLLILFCQLTERLCATQFSKTDLLFLNELIEDFFSNYLSEFPDTVLKPKAHFIQHYPQMIFRFGPLVKTLRFEAKHAFFKASLNSNKNRKNIYQSMAKKHQFWMYLHHSKGKCEKNMPEGISTSEVAIESFNNILANFLRGALEIGERDLLTKSQAVVMNGQRYSSGNVVVLGVDNDEYIFGKISCALFYKENTYLLCNILLVNCFSFHFNSYNVVETDDYNLVKVSDLYDYHPLGCYKIRGRNYVPLRHHIHIPDDEEI